jgi:hypothetical protein
MLGLIITTALRLPKSHILVRKADGKRGRGKGGRSKPSCKSYRGIPDSVNKKFGSIAGAGLDIGGPRSWETRGHRQGIREIIQCVCWRCILTPSRDLAYIEAAAPHQSYLCASPPSVSNWPMGRVTRPNFIPSRQACFSCCNWRLSHWPSRSAKISWHGRFGGSPTKINDYRSSINQQP